MRQAYIIASETQTAVAMWQFGPMLWKYVQLYGFANPRMVSVEMYNSGDEGGLNNGLSGPADILEAIYTDPSLPPGTLGMSQSMTDSGNSCADLWAGAAMVSTNSARSTQI